MTIDLQALSQACGPRAFSAITGAPPNTAATALMRWSRRAGYEPCLETHPQVLAAAAMMRGFQFERWSVEVGGWRCENADEFARRVWANIASMSREEEKLVAGICEFRRWSVDRLTTQPVIVQDAIRAATHKGKERRRRRAPTTYTVNEWLARRAIGTWVLFVWGHVMTARDGEIISGDLPYARVYGNTPLVDAWRVLPREGWRECA